MIIKLQKNAEFMAILSRSIEEKVYHFLIRTSDIDSINNEDNIICLIDVSTKRNADLHEWAILILNNKLDQCLVKLNWENDMETTRLNNATISLPYYFNINEEYNMSENINKFTTIVKQVRMKYGT